MTAWFKKATVACVAALSLALFSGGQLAAADETPTPSPTSESPSAPVTATTPAAPKSSAPADASAKEPAPETKTSAPETKPADPASPDSKATEKAAPKKKAAAKAPARTTPSDSTPSPSPQTDTKVTTSLSFAGAAQRRSAPQIAAADPEINFGVGYTQTCVPLGQDSVAITFTIENTGNTTGTAAISVAGPTKFDLGTVTLAPGESKTVGTKDMVVGDYTLTADFTDGQTRTLPIKIEACESPVTFATISSPTCATINDGVVNATIANTQATAGSFGVRFGGKTITVDVPAKGETPITLEGFAPGDHKV
ncbi:MAG: hypothetical protein L0G99_01465, partial [Propionibacteriales bacterium]|nr:hypothetical protein [Propionibacteriales bacterium]